MAPPKNTQTITTREGVELHANSSYGPAAKQQWIEGTAAGDSTVQRWKCYKYKRAASGYMWRVAEASGTTGAMSDPEVKERRLAQKELAEERRGDRNEAAGVRRSFCIHDGSTV